MACSRLLSVLLFYFYNLPALGAVDVDTRRVRCKWRNIKCHERVNIIITRYINRKLHFSSPNTDPEKKTISVCMCILGHLLAVLRQYLRYIVLDKKQMYLSICISALKYTYRNVCVSEYFCRVSLLIPECCHTTKVMTFIERYTNTNHIIS